MKSYYRVILGKGHAYAAECFAANCIAGGFIFGQDLSGKLPTEWRRFNEAFIPVFLAANPEKSKISAGLACGALWVLSMGIQVGDRVLCPDGEGHYHVGEVTGDYFYAPEFTLPHRRPVRWLPVTISRAEMSEALRNSTGAIGTVSNITSHREEIERLLGGAASPALVATDTMVEDAAAFAMESHLEDFLVENWAQTELGQDYDLYEEDGETGQQVQTDTGPLDILAVSKDKKRLLVVELKKGRASDAVVGQTLRYMGFVQDQLAQPGQTVLGAIVARDDDQRIRRALMMTPNIAFYRYQVSFKLAKV